MKLLKDGCDKKEFLSQVKDSQKMAKMINNGVDKQEVYDAFSKNITKENKIELSEVIDSLKDRKHALQCQAEAVKEKNKIIEDKKKKKQRKMKEKNVAVERKAGEVPGHVDASVKDLVHYIQGSSHKEMKKEKKKNKEKKVEKENVDPLKVFRSPAEERKGSDQFGSDSNKKLNLPAKVKINDNEVGSSSSSPQSNFTKVTGKKKPLPRSGDNPEEDVNVKRKQRGEEVTTLPATAPTQLPNQWRIKACWPGILSPGENSVRTLICL